VKLFKVILTSLLSASSFLIPQKIVTDLIETSNGEVTTNPDLPSNRSKLQTALLKLTLKNIFWSPLSDGLSARRTELEKVHVPSASDVVIDKPAMHLADSAINWVSLK